jgi:hypothetical protein
MEKNEACDRAPRHCGTCLAVLWLMRLVGLTAPEAPEEAENIKRAVEENNRMAQVAGGAGQWPPPLSSRTMSLTNFFASPKSIMVLSR